jgi:hypothetical protein
MALNFKKVIPITSTQYEDAIYITVIIHHSAMVTEAFRVQAKIHKCQQQGSNQISAPFMDIHKIN